MRSRPHSQTSNRPLRRPFSGRSIFIGAVLIFTLIAAAALLLHANERLAPEISADDAYRKAAQGAFLLDVREPEEWDAFHIPGAALIPLGELQSRIGEVPRDREVIVVCRSGNRSRSGRDLLLEAGFGRVTSLSGGVTAWSDAGYPIEGIRP